MPTAEQLRNRLDDVSLKEEELFLKRQGLVHHALRQETQAGLHDQYLAIREQEAELRYEHLRLENLLHPGHAYHDHGEDLGTWNVKRKYWYLFLMAASAAALLFLMARTVLPHVKKYPNG